jgi:HPt (histidine-containing phosphotransfer) domain-containing protein
MTMQAALLDLNYLYEISSNDHSYIHDVIEIFLGNTPFDVEKLEHLVRDTDDYVSMGRQAHLIKSSASIIKVRNMYDDLVALESMAKQEGPKEQMIAHLDDLLANFKEALPLIHAEEERTRQ